jgi:CheY-like chemotaxis protein
MDVTVPRIPTGPEIAGMPGIEEIAVAPHFTWSFPQARRQIAQPPHGSMLKGSSQEGETVDQRKALVLVVDDDPSIMSTVTDILEFEGYRVERAANGAEGLAILERTQPALILLDMRMPVLNGWEFARILKEQGINVPVVVMTAARDARRWAQEIGAQGYLEKPFQFDDLVSTVKNTILRV